MTHQTGHLPDAPAVVDARVGLHLHPEYGAMKAGTMPPFTTNRQKLRWLVNQTDIGGCEGCAHGSGTTLQLANDGTPLDEPVSHIGLYLQALMIDAPLNADGTLPWLVDVGTMPSSILGGMLTYGGAKQSVWGQMPMSSGTMYSRDSGAPEGALIQPSPTQLFGGRAFRLNGAYFLQSTGVALVRDLVRVMASGRVLTNAIRASGSAFQQYTGGVLGALSGAVDHAQLQADYTWTGAQSDMDAFMGGDDSKATLLQIHGVNSWGGVGCPDGGDWGEVDSLNLLGGQYRGNSAFIQSAEDWCVLDLTRVS